MSDQAVGDGVPVFGNDFISTHKAIATAHSILSGLLCQDRLWLSPRDETRLVVDHTVRLLSLASERLSRDGQPSKAEVEHHE